MACPWPTDWLALCSSHLWSLLSLPPHVLAGWASTIHGCSRDRVTFIHKWNLLWATIPQPYSLWLLLLRFWQRVWSTFWLSQRTFLWQREKVDLMLTFFFPIALMTAFVFLLVQAFRMMVFSFRTNGSHSTSGNQDRTGLLTTHPEILDQNGDIASEDLLVVKFPEIGESEVAPAWISYLTILASVRLIYCFIPVSYTHLTLPTILRV